MRTGARATGLRAGAAFATRPGTTRTTFTTRTAFATRRGAAAGFGAGRLAARFCTAARDFGTATTRVRAVLRAGIFAFAAAVLPGT